MAVEQQLATQKACSADGSVTSPSMRADTGAIVLLGEKCSLCSPAGEDRYHCRNLFILWITGCVRNFFWLPRGPISSLFCLSTKPELIVRETSEPFICLNHKVLRTEIAQAVRGEGLLRLVWDSTT